MKCKFMAHLGRKKTWADRRNDGRKTSKNRTALKLNDTLRMTDNRRKWRDKYRMTFTNRSLNLLTFNLFTDLLDIL